MAEPLDYTFKGIKSPQESFAQGFQFGNTLYERQQQRLLAEKKAAQEAQMQQDMTNLSANPTIGGIQQLMAKYPSFSEKFKPLLESMNATQKENRIRQANSIFMPLIAGDKELALDQLNQQIEAATNSGDTASQKSLDALKKTLESDKTGKLGDNMVTISMGSFLSEAMGPEHFAKTYEALAEQRRKEAEAPVKLKEAEAKAEKAAVESKFAESTAAADLEKKGWDIKKIQNDVDIAKQNSKIALMNAQIARETNQLKREELGIKVEEAKLKRDEHVRGKAADYESATSTIDNMLSTLGRIKNTDKDVIDRSTGPVASKMPIVTPGAADFKALVENLDAQTFLAQIPNMVGKGALSDAEGKKLTASLQNFSLSQSPERFMENVLEAERLMTKARKKLAAKYGVPYTEPELPEIAKPKGQQSVPTAAPRTVTVDY